MATKKHPLTILLFTPYFYPYISGLTQYPYRLFTESQLPLRATCLTFRHDRSLSKTETIQPSLHIQRMPFLFRISKGFISPQSLAFFWNETKKNDVVLLNLPSFEGIALALIAAIQGKPLISLLHCEVSLPFSPLNTIINFVLNCGVFIQLMLSKKIIVYTRDYYMDKRMYWLFRNKMAVILPPVHMHPPEAAYRSELRKLKKGYSHSVGFCGRIAAEKGIEVLIKSLSGCKDTVLFFAGPTGKDVIGEGDYFTKIKGLLADSSIPHVFLGTLASGKLSAFYKEIDILVLPSLNKTEAFGMVQVEAMLQGTPVIASSLPGVRVPIQLTRMGILIPPYDAQSITRAILTIQKSRVEFTRESLLLTAKKLFDPQKTYDSIYSVITQ